MIWDVLFVIWNVNWDVLFVIYDGSTKVTFSNQTTIAYVQPILPKQSQADNGYLHDSAH